jgi:HK97 family phage major capsid protein
MKKFTHGMFFEADKGGSSGGVMDDAQFKSTLLDGVKDLRSKNDTLVADFGRLDKETKSAFAELEKVRSDVSTINERVGAIKRIELQLQRESRMAFGDPVRRFLANEDNALAVRGMLKDCTSWRTGRGASEAERAAIKAITGGATPGSTYLPTLVLPEIYDVLAQYGVWNTFAVRRLGARATTLPVKTARALAVFDTEGAVKDTDSTKAGTSVSAAVKTASVLLLAANELLEDADVDVLGDILNDAAEAVAYKIDWAALSADGTADATDGGFTGIFGGGGTAATAANGNTTVETLDFEDVLRCLTTVGEGILQRPCRWWIHPQIIARLLSVKDDNGRPIFLSAMDAPSYGGIGSILGYPVTPAAAAPSTNTAGSKVAAFGDPNGQVVGIRKDFEFAASPEAGFTANGVYFRGLARIATKIRAATAFAVLTTAAQ